MINIKRFKFNFINVPKNASTSIRRFFIDNVVQPEDSFSNYIESETEIWSQGMAPEHAGHSHMDVQYAVDNGLLDRSETVVGVIREPVDRVLSLYLYRAKQGRISNPGVLDFRHSVAAGFYPDMPWQNQLQSSFLKYNGEPIGNWWLFENVQRHIDEFSEQHNIIVNRSLKIQNKSIKNHNTNEYIGIFYDDATLKSVNKYYEEDIELYNRIKDSKC